jgi:hypothetical protein
MSITKLFQPKIIAIVLAALTISVVAYGFAAANDVPESGAGDGSGTISGYDITNIDYTLLTSDPTKVESVSFDVTATAGASTPDDVRVTVDAGTTWITCTGPTTDNWSCAFGTGSEPSVSDLSLLQVVAVE